MFVNLCKKASDMAPIVEPVAIFLKSLLVVVLPDKTTVSWSPNIEPVKTATPA